MLTSNSTWRHISSNDLSIHSPRQGKSMKYEKGKTTQSKSVAWHIRRGKKWNIKKFFLFLLWQLLTIYSSAFYEKNFLLTRRLFFSSSSPLKEWKMEKNHCGHAIAKANSINFSLIFSPQKTKTQLEVWSHDKEVSSFIIKLKSLHFISFFFSSSV